MMKVRLLTGQQESIKIESDCASSDQNILDTSWCQIQADFGNL